MRVVSSVRWRSASAALCALLVSGCIAIPIAPPQEEEPFSGTTLDFVVIGETTREDVHKTLAAEPLNLQPLRFDEDHVWVYRGSRDTWGWLVCAGGGYYADCDTFDSGRRSYFLSIDFDDAGVVSGYYVSDTTGTCVNDTICSDGGSTMVFARPQQDAQAKRLDPGGQCAIYVYATLPGNVAPGAFSAWVDDRPLGALVSSDGYFRFVVDPGEHVVETRYMLRHIRSRIEIDCTAGNVYFVHHDVQREGIAETRAVLENAAAGRQALANRRLVLIADQPKAIGIAGGPR